MAGYVVVGTQWGDEGKGKIIDVLADMFNGFMVIPNAIALLFAGNIVKDVMMHQE